MNFKRGCIHIHFIEIGQILIKLRPHPFFSYLAPKKVIFEWIWLLFDTMEYTIQNSNIKSEFTDLQRGCIHIHFIKIGQILIKLRPHQFFSYLAPKKVIFEWICLLFDTMMMIMILILIWWCCCCCWCWCWHWWWWWRWCWWWFTWWYWCWCCWWHWCGCWCWC